MSNILNVLQTVFLMAQQAAQQPAAQPKTTPLTEIWQLVNGLHIVEALTFISFGVVCLFYGWRIFKILVTICFGLVGLIVADKANLFIKGNVVWVGIFFVVVFAVFSYPLMRWGVSLLGSLSGGILTAGVTLALGLHDQRMLLAGGLVGLVAGGMISFIVFKIAVILFTSLGGSGLMVVGLLAVLHQNLDPKKFETFVFTCSWFLPVLLMVPMIVGVVLQYRFIKTAQDWSV
jgi:hypothetical protein